MFYRKACINANSGDPDQMPHLAASELGLHCLQNIFLEVSRLKWVSLIATDGTFSAKKY